MSKYDSALAEAANTIADNGFALYENGTVEDPEGWNALVEVTSTGLLNLDADEDLIKRLNTEQPEARNGEVLTWIRADSDGFVKTIAFGPEAEGSYNAHFPN